MSGAVLIRRSGAPLVIDWGRAPRGAAPDSGGSTPQVRMAFARLFAGTVVDWGRMPYGTSGAAPPAATDSDYITRARRRGRRAGR